MEIFMYLCLLLQLFAVAYLYTRIVKQFAENAAVNLQQWATVDANYKSLAEKVVDLAKVTATNMRKKVVEKEQDANAVCVWIKPGSNKFHVTPSCTAIENSNTEKFPPEEYKACSKCNASRLEQVRPAVTRQD